MKKRIFCILLCLCMAITLLPTAALAEVTDSGSDAAAKVTDNTGRTIYYTTLTEAFDNAESTGTALNDTVLTLMADTTQANIDINAGVFTLDLNGFTWRKNASNCSSLLRIREGCSVTIRDSSQTKSGKMEGGTVYGTIWLNNANLTIESGTFTSVSTGSYNVAQPVLNIGGLSAQYRLSIKGGTFTYTSVTHSWYNPAINFAANCAAGTVQLSGGTFGGNSGSDGTLYTDGTGSMIGRVYDLLADGYTFDCVPPVNAAQIDGTVQVIPSGIRITRQPESPDTLAEGYTQAPTLTAAAVTEPAGDESSLTYQWYQNGTIIDGAVGASYTVPTGLAAVEGGYTYVCMVSYNGRTVAAKPAYVDIVMLNPAATVNGSTYATITGALAKANTISGAIVTLLRDVDISDENAAGNLTANKNMTLDLNGHTLNVRAYSFAVGAGKTVTIQDESESRAGVLTGSGTCTVSSAGTLYINSGTISNNNNSGAAINVSGSFRTYIYGGTIVGGQCLSSTGTNYVIVYGGSLQSTGALCCVNTNTAPVWIYGGNFNCAVGTVGLFLNPSKNNKLIGGTFTNGISVFNAGTYSGFALSPILYNGYCFYTGTAPAVDSVYELSATAKTIKVTVTVGLKPIPITYEGMDGATPGSSSPTACIYDTEVQISDPVKDGWVFVGWSINDSPELFNNLTLETKNYGASIKLTANWKQRETTPDIAIDYANETLTGFGAGSYTIGGSVVSPDANGILAIDGAWFGTSLRIVKSGDGTTTADSDAQSLAIPTHPSLSGVSKTDCATFANNDGKLTGVTADMEYKIGDSGWTEGTGIDITGIPAGTTYTVRIKATESDFASMPDDFTIAAYEASFTVTFNANGGSVIPASALTGTDGKLTWLPAPTHSWNYSFIGWFTAKSGGSPITTSTVFPEDTTIYAHWLHIDGNIVPPIYNNSYNITAAAGTGGTISPSGSASALAGSSATYTITPNAGYVIDDVTVDGNSVGAVGAYTFVNINKNHVISAFFKKEAHSDQVISFPFTDVTKGDWFYDDVAYVYERKLMQGTDTAVFSPYITTTRGMIVTILYRLEGEPSVSGKCPFDDVESGSYYENAVTWAAANGIVNGYGDGNFGPDDKITREQLAAIFCRYATYKGGDVSVGEDTDMLSYGDALDISEYAVSAMQWAVGAGLIHGDGGRLMPRGEAERCQVAAILHRFCENVK